MLKRLTYIVFIALVVQACVPQQNGRHYNRNGSVSVVSASRGEKQYVSSMKQEYSSYISALEAAKQENDQGKQIKTGEKPSSTIEYSPLNGKALSAIWGKPVGSVGDGVTLLNAELRTRFNDAVSTTPVSSQAKWRYGERSFIFMPNSDMFQPYYSGGNCRDGVFINYIGGHEERLRGLFCQKGRGADWYLIK